MNANHDRQRTSKPKAWLMAARPKTLPAAVAPVLVGSALAYAQGVFVALPALAALGGGLLIQVAVNLANDYFDFVRGVDTQARQGPPRVVQSGLISPDELKTGLGVVMWLAVLIGVYLTVVAGWPVVVIGVLSLVCALAYSGGPFPLASRGLGDVFVFIFFGLVAVGGTYYVQAQTFSSWALLVAVPVGTLTTAVLVVNNLRDIETDEAAGKITLAVMLGPGATRVEYHVLLLVSYLMPLFMWWQGWSAWVMLPWLTLPLTAWLMRRTQVAETGTTLNSLLAQTAQLALLFCLLFSLGMIL